MSRVGLINRAMELIKLEDGWFDGQGVAPDADAIANAWLLADFLFFDANLYPVPEGGVQVEWTERDERHEVIFYNKPVDK